MRILTFVSYFPPELGAASKRLDALTRAWVAAGAEVDVVAPLPHYPSGTIADGYGLRSILRPVTDPHGRRIRYTPVLPTSRGGVAKLIDQVVAGTTAWPVGRGVDPDVIVATLPALPSLVAAVAAHRRTGAPLVVELRDAWPDLIVESGLAGGRTADRIASLVNRGLRQADLLVTTTQSFAEELRRRFPDQTVVCIPNGVDIDDIPVLAPRARTADDPLRLLYLGNHGVSQGLDVIIDAVASLDERPVCRFVGEGTMKADLRERAAVLGVEIDFRDPVGPDAVFEHYAWADTCLVPLRDWPSFRRTVPSKIYEIMATGRHLTGCIAGEAAGIVTALGGGDVIAPERPDELAATLRRLTEIDGPLEPAIDRRLLTSIADRARLARTYLDLLDATVEGRLGDVDLRDHLVIDLRTSSDVPVTDGVD